jgi:tetratricopeptide (TPR) repeat protein
LKKHIKKIIAASIVALVIGVPGSLYSYNSYNYNRYFSQAQKLIEREKYDEAESSFNNALKYNKKQSPAVREHINSIAKLKEYKNIYDSGLNEMENNRYIEAANIFEFIKEDGGAIYNKAQEKTVEAKNLFITESLEKANKLATEKNFLEGINHLDAALKIDSENGEVLKAKSEYTASYINDNLNKAKEEASTQKYTEAIKTLDNVFALDANHSEAQRLKEDYNKAILSQKEALATKEAAAKASAAAPKTSSAPKTSGTAPQPAIKIAPRPSLFDSPQRVAVSQVQGQAAIINEFKKMGFVFSSDTTAMYSKNGIDIGLVDRGDLWQIATKVWGSDVEDLFTDCMTILVGKDGAHTGQFLISQVFDYGQSHQQGSLKAFINNGMLVIHVTKP